MITTIRVNLDALREIHWHEYLTRFLLGGAICAVTGLIGERYGAEVAGLFLAFPAIFPAGATLLEKHEREKKQSAGIMHTSRGRLASALDARGAAMGSIALGAFAVVIWKLLPDHNAALVLAGALALWLALAVVLWRVRKLHVYFTRHRAPAGPSGSKKLGEM